ncbi:hypothetical protein DCO58_08135 [Helicobacter saguini]|uniref:Uncharacterized protein n=1 Tax=Helicobacter saguini TaxID=1548018 RepID=A0A099BE25_9HELI|nr:hypothetical protein [Helicobacter saguini]MWV61706.1 hypothetical protein [Helicobacter saguini]MWV62180.1 hypothetical protein [Helicobacter saguini]MWV67146.1 hypothetical protein [Helicobacter saguini]MWV67622.1 hypothetical protein [Helicobacter saguini]MWV69499.1 hypothetical protein [Helicobacter saguini]
MIESIFIGIAVGIMSCVICPIAPSLFLFFYLSLFLNIVFFYILNRFLVPNILFSKEFMKSYFIGMLIVIVLFETIGFCLIPASGHINPLADIDEIRKQYNGMSKIIFEYEYVNYNVFFIGFILLKIMIFFISRWILSYIFKNEYKHYAMRHSVISFIKPNKHFKYIAIFIGVFFTLTNIDILGLQQEIYPHIPIVVFMELIYKYFLRI